MSWGFKKSTSVLQNYIQDTKFHGFFLVKNTTFVTMHRNSDFTAVGENVCRCTIAIRQPLKG